MLKVDYRRLIPALICVALLLLLVILVASLPGAVAQADVNEACKGGPTIEEITLDQCYVERFDVNDEPKSITIWYTFDKTPYRIETDPGPPPEYITRTHGLDSVDQAQYGAELAREAWETYFRVFRRSPRDTGPNCDGNIDVWVYDTSPWPSSAPWPHNIDDCQINIKVSELFADPRYAFYHEFFHYLQYAYDDACYDFLYDTYKFSGWEGSADMTEGYADLGIDIINQPMDDLNFPGFVNKHRHWRSIYNEGYWNLFTKYFAEQVGTQWDDVGALEYHMDAVREHYEECDAQGSMYVLEDLVPRLTGGALTMEELVMNFFAANYAYRWVDHDTYPELFYVDHGTPDYGDVRHIESVSLTGTHSWHGEFVLTRQEDGLLTNWDDTTLPADLSPMPQEWAAYYYQADPQPGCDYITARIQGEPGARLGMNLIARNAAPNMADYFRRFTWIGEEFSRTFHRRSNDFPIVAIVNSFDSVHEYDVSFECVTPLVIIREPRQQNFALVGDPSSPSTFLLRFEVLSDGSPVRGLTEADIQVWIGGKQASLVGGTFQEVGQEYWAIVQPPLMTAGTTWANVDVYVNADAMNTEDQALLYVEPGHTDIALLFDASSSMEIEDVPGEGARYENAQKAGTIVADLLREGDRVAVMDFSAISTTDPTYDIRTLLPLTEVVVPDTIADAKDAISQISPRNLTPIGQALVEAKNELMTAPSSTNPKTIILLSDGEENVVPYYDQVAAELDAWGVVIDTISLSGDADEDLMARIAAENSGTYRHVPTLPGGARGLDEAQRAQLVASGLPEEIVSPLATTVLPGPLGLDEAYDYFETKSQGASRLFLEHHTEVLKDEWVTAIKYVDSSARRLRLVVGSKQPYDPTPECLDPSRTVEVLPPGADPATGWISIAPVAAGLPAGWSVRNSTYDDVLVVDSPAAGYWRLRAQGWTGFCRAGDAVPSTIEAETFDFMLSGSVQSDIRLQGRFLSPIVDNHGLIGDHVPIIATLLDDDGGVAGADVVAVVDTPSDSVFVTLEDDGNHGDASADDGIYGALFSQTDQAGPYNVRMVGAWREGGTGDWLTREWSGAFWLRGIEGPSDDGDGDNMPDWWEEAHGLDTRIDDALEDLDLDGLRNIHELQVGARPNQTDTDHGGENDYSEAQAGRDPSDPADDMVGQMGVVTTMAYSGRIVIHWPYPDRFGDMQLWVSTDPDDKGTLTNIGTAGVFTLSRLTNDRTYYLRFAPIGLDGRAIGELTAPIPVTPKADPDAPNGTILINGGAPSTASKDVILNITASDIPLDGPSSAASGAVATRWTRALNEVSGGIEMRLSNDGSFVRIPWEPLTFHKPWTLGDSDSEVYRVYAQFRDAAGNLSLVVYDDIRMWQVYLPLVMRRR